METKVIGNPDGWYQAWKKVLDFVNEYNFTPLSSHMVLFLLACGLVLWGCWLIWITYIRPPKTVGGGH